jgi:hypothetical protein
VTQCHPTVCYTILVTQVQMQHTDVQEDGAGFEIDIDHTYTPRCDGSGTVFLVASITGMLLVHSRAHFATCSLKIKCTVCVAVCRCLIQVFLFVLIYFYYYY